MFWNKTDDAHFVIIPHNVTAPSKNFHHLEFVASCNFSYKDFVNSVFFFRSWYTKTRVTVENNRVVYRRVPLKELHAIPEDVIVNLFHSNMLHISVPYKKKRMVVVLRNPFSGHQHSCVSLFLGRRQSSGIPFRRAASPHVVHLKWRRNQRVSCYYCKHRCVQFGARNPRQWANTYCL